MRHFVLTLAAATLLAPALASAQAPTTTTQKTGTTTTTTQIPSRGTTTRPTYEFGVGYQYLRTGQFCAAYDETACDSSDPKGFPFGIMLDGVRNWGGLGLVGEAGWSSDDDDPDGPTGDRLQTDILSYSLGLRYTFRLGRFWPYLQGTGGGITSRFDGVVGGGNFHDTRSRVMAQAGGGVTFVAGDGWGLFFDGAYRRTFLDEEVDFVTGRNDVRASVGFRLILD